MYILGFDYKPPYSYYEPSHLKELNTLELLHRSIDSARQFITNDIIVCSDLCIDGVINETLTKDPFQNRFEILLEISEKYKEDILFVEHDVVFLKNPGIHKLFFNVGIKDSEPTGDLIFVEYEKLKKLKSTYKTEYQNLKRPEFEKPSFACYKTFKRLEAMMGYNLVLYVDLKKSGLIRFGSMDPIAVHSHYSLSDIFRL